MDRASAYTGNTYPGDIGDLCVAPDATVREVIALIDRVELQVALVVDRRRSLLGTITDGDVRRALLRGLTLEAPAQEVMNRTPVTANDNLQPSAVEALMQRTTLRRIPIIDAGGVVLGLALPQSEARLPMADSLVIVMAGGLGTRLGDLTRDCPKPLLKVGAKPILETILECFIAQGFHRFLISVNYKADMIEEFFGNGERWGARIDYLREDRRLGTAGGLGLLADLPASPLVVMNGDVLTKVDFRKLLDFHLDNGQKATMAVREYDMQVPFGVVDLQGHRVDRLVEKPVQRFFVNAGIYVLDPSCLRLIPRNTYFDMTTLFQILLEQGLPVGSFPIHEYWQDVGRLDDFETANLAYAHTFAA